MGGGAWELWQSALTATPALFPGEAGHTNGFLSVARDQAGNVQPTPATAQATTTVGGSPVPQPELQATTVRLPDGITSQVTLTYDVLPGYTYTVKSNDHLSTTPGWNPLPGAPHQTGTVIDTTAAPRRFYRLLRTSP